MSSTNYEELYGVKLLDDLHNYFPALLYDTARFQTVRDVLGYITMNTRNRFDLYSFGQRNYIQTSLPPQQPADQTPPLSARRTADISGVDVPLFQPRSRVANTNTYADAVRNRNPLTASVELYTEDLSLDNSALSLMNLVNLLNGFPSPLGLMQGAGGRVRNTTMEDVVVSASEQQIEAASTRAFPEADTICSICQDNIGTNEMGRKLNHCGHTFHIRCIDTWFSRNVHCPICRHDIRETNESEEEN